MEIIRTTATTAADTHNIKQLSDGDHLSPVTSERIAAGISGAAKILDVSRPTIYKLIESGDLRANRFAGVVRIPLVDIYALLGLDFIDPTSA